MGAALNACAPGLRRSDPNAYMRAWRADHQEERREYSRKYHKKRMATSASYRGMKRDASRWTRRKIKYGITKADYEKQLTEQKGCCTICGVEAGYDLRVDHDHSTGKFRELLCANCNAGLGHFRDSPENLTAAIVYLKRHDQRLST